MKGPLIQVGGGVRPKRTAVTAQAIAELLRVGADTRTPEAVMLKALSVFGQHCHVEQTTITDCHLTGEKTSSL